MAKYYIAAKRLDKDRKTTYVKKSKAYDDEWKANVFLKDSKKKHPKDDWHVIKD
jgi:hypothetical protein